MKGQSEPSDSNTGPAAAHVTAMPSAPPPYSEVVGHAEVQGNAPPPGFSVNPPPYSNQPQAGYPGYPAYPQSAQPFPGQPGFGNPNPTFISVVQHPSGASRIEVINTSLGAGPARIKCPRCSSDVITSTTTGPSWLAHLCCLAMFVTGFWLCSCLPYCISSFDSTVHQCPNCKAVVGSFREGC